MKAVTDRDDRALIRAEFLRQVYVAEKMRQARLSGLLPVPEKDPLGERLMRLARSSSAS